MVWRVTLGTFSIVLTMVVLGFVAVTEQDRMASFTTAYDARRVEAGARLLEANCARCHGLQGQGGIGPALNSIDLFSGQRLAEIKWQGGLENYLRGVINAGRPRASAAFANAAERMPAWGQEFGGPLRQDEVGDLVAFIVNWGEAYKDASGKIPSATPTPCAECVGTDITGELPAGDATRGQALVTSLGCVACHITAGGQIAPAWEAAKASDGKGVGTHALERWQAADYAGQASSPEQYLLESIVEPSAYIVPGNPVYAPSGKSTMPADYGGRLPRQDAADIIAYLLTLK